MTHINMSNQTLPPTHLLKRKLFFRYIAWVGMLNFAWEILQLPLYTLWYESPPTEIAFAVVHCTLGDILIASLSFFAALALSNGKTWPLERYWRIALLAVFFGGCYTVFSEWNNTVVTRAWAYSSWMPTLGGIGLSPVLQWLSIPMFVFWKLSERRLGGRVGGTQC